MYPSSNPLSPPNIPYWYITGVFYRNHFYNLWYLIVEIFTFFSHFICFAFTITSIIREPYHKLSLFKEGKYHKIAPNVLF